MGMDDNYHRLLDQNMALIETPLVAPAHAYFPQHFKTALYPYNISGYHRQHQHGMHGGHFGSPHGNGNGHNGHNGGGMEYGYHLEASVAPAVGNILISMDGEDDGADAAIENGKFYDNAVERHSRYHPDFPRNKLSLYQDALGSEAQRRRAPSILGSGPCVHHT